jgi:riboflavin kinase / FMN adenylyltransferase
MEVIRSLDEVPRAGRGRALAVGTFDGVHLGHRAVITDALEHGRAEGIPVAAVTFDPHPNQVLRPDDPPQLLTSAAVKADLIAALGVDELVIIPFTREFSRLEADEFCSDVLVAALQARTVSVGANFRFGHAARGDVALLQSRPEFETAIVPLVERGEAPISSSRIRQLVAHGDVSAAAELLGSPFQLEGAVVEGDARGRSLGMPTANVAPNEDLLVPGPGIYAGLGLGHQAAISVGVRPTFETDGQLLVEAHLLDFEGDLYGQTMRLAFLERLRDELRFESAEELAEQMRRDVEQVRTVLASLGPSWQD